MNTRWALAIVGVAIIIGAAVVIGTGKDDTDATPVQGTATEATGQTGKAGTTGSTGDSPTEKTSKSGGSKDNSDSGGASPDDGSGNSGNQSGGAAPELESGGAKAMNGVITPVLTASNPRTVKVDKGEIVTIRARANQNATLHVHGYDKTVAIKAGAVGLIRLRATIDGEFAIEFHYSGSEAEAGTLRVSP